MKLLGLDISRRKVAVEEKAAPALYGVSDRGWWPAIRESFTGAWQRNVTVDASLATSYHAVFACATLIASDIAKNRIKLVEFEPNANGGIWVEATNPAYSPVLRKPNPYQTRIQFWEYWILSKLLRGNTYGLKARDQRNIVTAIFVLDPSRVRPLVSDTGDIFYELQADNLAGLTETVVVPAREIIHDRMNCLFHPLVGISPIYASALAATQGLNIQNNSAKLFGNNSSPGGILTSPGNLTDDQARQMKEQWEEKFTGDNVGRVAVLSGGLKFEPISLTAVDAQLIEQLKWSAEVVCSTFHVPPYKIGIGQMPTYNNIQSLNVEYYSQCLQKLFEDAELCLDDGLGIGEGVGPAPFFGTEFDIENLLRMDSVTQMEVLDKGKSIMTPDEQRGKLGLPPTAGGNVVYRQQQDFSLAALAKRDAQDDPFANKSPPQLPAPAARAAALEGTRDVGSDQRLALRDDLIRRSRVGRLAA